MTGRRPWLAVRAIARRELGRRWRSLVALGLLAGVLGGLVLAAATVTRRTESTPARLQASVTSADAHAQVFGGGELVEAVRSRPEVVASFAAGITIARLAGPNVVYLGMFDPLTTADGALFRPAVVSGRAPDPARPDEVLLLEGVAEELGARPGDTLTLSLLTAEEASQFDTGFGEPDGPTRTFTVTGLARVPPGLLDGTPLVTTPAFAAEVHDLFVGHDLLLDLRRDGGDLAALQAGVDEAVRAAGIPAGADFAPVTIDDPGAGTAGLRAAIAILVGGLVVAAVAAGVASAVALAQTWARHHAGTSSEQRVERALGLTGGERVAARVLPASLAGAIAVAVSAGVAAASGAVDPVGAAARFEPQPGFRFDATVTVVGAVVVGTVTLALAALTASRAGSASVAPSRRAARWQPWRWRRATTLAGGAFARSGPRSAVPGAVLAGIAGVAGMVGGLTVSASLDRLVDTPVRQGWSADLTVVDVDDAQLARLTTDPRTGAVADVRSVPVRVGGGDVKAYASIPLRGTIAWTTLDGRPPTGPDEAMVGSVLARRLGVGPGDRLPVGADGIDVTVVGVGVGAPLEGEPLGDALLVSPALLDRLATTTPFRQALVRLAPGVALDATAAELGASAEVMTRSVPPEVRHVADLGALPVVLGSFLAALGVVALAHALSTVVRARRRDVAVLRALGATSRQLAAAVITTSMLVVGASLAIGVPLGWLVARLSWGELARSVGVADDVLVPTGVWLVVAGALAAGLAAAAVPSRRARVVAGAQVLRSE